MQTDPEAALIAIDESVVLTRAGASEVVLGFVLAMRSKLRVLAGDREGAIADLQEAIATARDKTDLIILVTALGRGAELLARLGSAEPAAVLAGFVSGPMSSLDSMPREERLDREQALDSARQALGHDGFDRALQRGRGMALEAVTAYAVAELDRLAFGD